MNAYKNIAALFLFSLFIGKITAQTGTFSASFTSENPLVKPVSLSFSKSVFKFDNPHGYWFINPHNNYKHFNTQPDQGYGDRKEEANGIGFITFTQTENDFDTYDLNDSISIQLQKGKNIIKAPKYDPQKGDKNKPLHIHITSISPTEISFTISGAAALSYTEGYAEATIGSITGSGHFYREPQYAKSDVLPGCNCDATIYASVYDAENNIRTATACENALSNKIFDAMQKTFAPVFSNVQTVENGAGQPGQINIDMLPGHININVPAKDRDYCTEEYNYNHLTGYQAEKKMYNNEDGYGLRFIKLIDAAVLPGANDQAAMQNYMKDYMKVATQSDSLMKLFLAKKITQAEYEKKVNALKTPAAPQSTGPDLKKEEIDHSLNISVFLNPDNAESMLMKVSDRSKTVVQHNIKGAAFEIYSPMMKDNDGSWLSNKMFVYFGKFSTPVAGKSGGGFDAETTKAIYPLNANKLSVYSIIIRLEGSKDLIDKAIANIDFDSLQSLISK